MTEYHTLFIHDLRLSLSIGVTPSERATPQAVAVNVEIRFHARPDGAQSDRIDDTICYGDICEAILHFCADRKFMLIEKLAHDLLLIVRKFTLDRGQVALTVHKLNTPIANLMGGTRYRVGDFA